MNRLGVLASILLAFVVVGCTSAQDTIAHKETGVFLVMNEMTDPATSTPDGAIGTGFFVGENQILTNAHVVGKLKDTDVNQKLSVKLENSGAYEVEVVHIDVGIDLALLKIKDWDKFKKENPVTILTLANPDDIKVMDEVYAIGNPWGLTFSISKGIVSNPLRRMDPVPKFMVQTDAHVYQGNSGGPLLNAKGEVVGVNSIMISKEGGSYGLAIQSGIIRKMLDGWEKGEDVKWATIGVQLKDDKTIDKVNPDSPAEKAGLKSGDKIIGFPASSSRNAIEFENSLDVTYNLSLVNDPTIRLMIERDGKTISLDVTPIYKTSKEMLQ